LEQGFYLQYHSRAITPKAKMIIINTPHNPVGKVFTREELEKIAVLAEEFNLLVMSDEVVRFLFVLLNA
jgi:aspartate/methionine/tyrosine aminotransferase